VRRHGAQTWWEVVSTGRVMAQGLVRMEVEGKSSRQVRQVHGDEVAAIVAVFLLVMVVSKRWETGLAISKEICWCGVVGFRESG
jgi:hypothetical protein